MPVGTINVLRPMAGAREGLSTDLQVKGAPHEPSHSLASEAVLQMCWARGSSASHELPLLDAAVHDAPRPVGMALPQGIALRGYAPEQRHHHLEVQPLARAPVLLTSAHRDLPGQRTVTPSRQHTGSAEDSAQSHPQRQHAGSARVALTVLEGGRTASAQHCGHGSHRVLNGKKTRPRAVREKGTRMEVGDTRNGGRRCQRESGLSLLLPSSSTPVSDGRHSASGPIGRSRPPEVAPAHLTPCRGKAEENRHRRGEGDTEARRPLPLRATVQGARGEGRGAGGQRRSAHVRWP